MYKDHQDSVGMCTSLAEWDPETRTAALTPWAHFVTHKLPSQKYAAGALQSTSIPVVGGLLVYYLTFNDSSLTHAQVWTNSNVANALVNLPLTQVPETSDGLIKGPGIYFRPSFIGAMPYYTGAEKNIMDYYAVKIMDSDFHVFEDRYALMSQEECEWNQKYNNGTTGTTIARYPVLCPK